MRCAHKQRGNAGVPLCQPPYGYEKSDNPQNYWVIDEEAAEVVRRIYKLCIDGYGIEQTARILQEDKVLIPSEYWISKGIKKPGKRSAKGDPYHWCKTTITKILTAREYAGDLVNFKTYSKSYKNRKRLENPVENQAVFEDAHEAIIDALHGRWCNVSGKISSGGSQRTHSGICFPGCSTAPTAAASCTTTSTIPTPTWSISTAPTTGAIGEPALPPIISG